MPLLTRAFIKTALIYLVLALALGIWLAEGAPNGLFPAYIHLLVFGWLTQLTFGVIYWMFPKYSAQLPRGHEWLGWVAYGALNAGLILRAVAEPMQASHASRAFGIALLASAILQWIAGAAFFVNTWGRVRER
jgi:hypothetical protein